MSCYRPLQGNRDPVSGDVWIGSDPSRSGRGMELPCGKCIGCRMDRARGWQVRILHEAQLYDTNWMATFTYDDSALPEDWSLRYSDFQAAMKRLRKRVEGEREVAGGRKPIRFFCSGEYGTVRGRPHFHAILFNCRFGDESRLYNGSYRSALADAIWSRGIVGLDDVTVASAAYVAGYVTEKVHRRVDEVVSVKTGELFPRRKEFCQMSRRPGLGSWWYDRFGYDLFPQDHAILRDGKRHKVPRFYYERYRREADADKVEELEERRFARAMEQRSESTPERRAVREELEERRIEFYSQREDL